MCRPMALVSVAKLTRTRKSTVPLIIFPELSRTTWAMISATPVALILVAGTSFVGSITARKYAVSATWAHTAVANKNKLAATFLMATGYSNSTIMGKRI